MEAPEVTEEDAKVYGKMHSWLYIGFKNGTTESMACNLTPEAFVMEWNNPFTRSIKFLTQNGFVVIRKRDVSYFRAIDYKYRPQTEESVYPFPDLQ